MKKLHHNKVSKGAYFLLLFFFEINDRFLKSKFLDKWIWFLIKIELFYIDGGCKKTGLCCEKLVLFEGENKINDPKQNTLEIFKPIKENDELQFSCTRFDQSKKICLDYNNRPQLCRDYPYSSFLKFDSIRQGCGYELKYKDIKIRNKKLKKKVKTIKILNNIK